MFLRFALGVCLASTVAACGEPVCETGEEASCVLPTPCEALDFGGCGGFAEVRILAPGDPVPVGDDALASPGDFILLNDRFTLVVDGLGHPHFLAPSGGAMLDAVADGAAEDALIQISQAVGLGAGDGVVYDRYRILETGEGAALQVRGTLLGDESHKVLTRYEIRRCEPGIRIRTEVYNRGSEEANWTLGDVWVHGERGHLPLPPVATGAVDPAATESLAPMPATLPFLSTIPSSPGGSVYGCVPCDAPRLSGFVGSALSVVGKEERSVSSGDREVFERFVIVTRGDDAAASADVAYDLRRQLFGNSFATVSGRVSPRGSGPAGDETRATVIIEGVGGARAGAPVPLTQVTPDSEGRFEARVPHGEDLEVVSLSFGREVARVAVPSSGDALDAGDVAGGEAGRLRITTSVDGMTSPALVVVIPADAATAAAALGRRFGAGPICAPLLGPAFAGNPACNRLLANPSVELDVPPGRYRVVASRGPFATLAGATVSVDPGGAAEATLAIASLPLLVEGARSVDLHAHGPRSFDATAPVDARIAAFLAADLDVVAMTDHDVLADYEGAAGDAELEVLTGLETTGQRPFSLFSDGPTETIGRFGFLPLSPVPSGPWRGAPADEAVEPGVLITRVVSAGFDIDMGLVQLLRPWGQPVLGRHVGFPRAIGLDARRTLPSEFDGSAQGLFRRTPTGARHANDAFHTIEILSGEEPEAFVAQRAFWHYLLAQNVLRAATGGGGSHGIGDAVPGSPRTVVTPASTALTDLFAALRSGRALATNGPIIEVTMLDAAGIERRPSTTPFELGAAARISVRVLAAPWIPVEEVRIVVNGEVLTVLRDELSTPADPFGADGTLRFEGEIDITAGLPTEFGDAFIIVEAGAPLTPAADLDCDGIPETGDNDGNGDIDADDIGIRAGPATPAPPVMRVADVCLEEAGPLRRAPIPADPDDPRHIFAMAMGFAPTATTNPLLVDIDGGGYDGAPIGLTP